MDNLQTNMSNGSIPENSDVKKLSLWQRIIGIITAPSDTMKSIVERPKILFPILLMIFAPVLINIARYPLYEESIRTATIKNNEVVSAKFNLPAMTPEQLDKAVSQGAITGLIGSPFGVIIAWLITTAVLFAIIKIFKGKGGFKQYLAVTGYTYMITAVSLLLTFGVSFATNSLNLDASLAVFAGKLLAGTEETFMFGFLYTVLRKIDIFIIWGYAVMALGIVHLSRLSRGKAYTAVIILFALSTIFSAVLAGFGEAMSGTISSLL